MLQGAGPAAALTLVWAVATTTGPFASVEVNDLYVYSVMAEAVRGGLFPYSEFGFEYPPLALAVIGPLGGSAWGWGIAMLVCALVAQAFAGMLAGPRAAWAMVALPVVAGALVRTHFDLLAVAIVFGALVALARDRPVLGLALLGAGTMTKLFPAIVAVVAVAWLWGRGERRAAVRGALAFAAVVGAIALPFVAAGGFPRDMVEFHSARPVQIESAPATVLFALGDSHVTGTNLRPDRFKSNGLDGGADGLVLALFTLAQLAVLGLVVFLAARRPDPRALVVAAFAAVLAFVALGKVLSPQFMCWTVPFAAVLAGWRMWTPAALTAAASLATQLWFPVRYVELVQEDRAMIAAVALRNALLLAALATTLRALVRRYPPGCGAESWIPQLPSARRAAGRA